MTWTLIGGPAHGDSGEGEVPEGYEFVSSGQDLPLVYEMRVRSADEVYRWGEDVEYIRDGRRIVATFNEGGYAVPAEYKDLAALTASLGMESLSAGIGFLHDQPRSDLADQARQTIDLFREQGLV